MNEFQTLSDVWRVYDAKDKKGFSFYDVSAAIECIPKDSIEVDACRYESMAFSFSENCGDNVWGVYYGPQWTLERKETGEPVYIPDIKDVSGEMISYWESRAAVVVNPLLKMRYTGLIMELKKKVTNEEPDYKTIKLVNVQALITVVENDYCGYEITTFDYAERALSLAIGFRNKDLQKQAVKAFYEADKRLSKDDLSPGIGRIFQSLIKHREEFSEYEEVLLQEQLDRFERLKQLAIIEGGKTDRYTHVLSDQVNLLVDYYHTIGLIEKAEPFFEALLDAIKVSIPIRGGLWGQGMIQQMQSRLRKYGFDKRANQLYVDLRNLAELSLADLKPIEVSIPFDSEKVNAYLDKALQGSPEEALRFFIVQYLPKLDEEKRLLKDNEGKSPLLDMIPTVTIDSSGNIISNIGVGPEVAHQKLYFNMYEHMRIAIPFIHLHITKMKENEKMTVESMMDLLKDSPLITEDRREIIRRGFEAFIHEDYLVSCHLLIPQLENAIRCFFALRGGNIMRAQKNPAGGNEYLSLDGLLSSSNASEYMGEDKANYYRNVLTDPNGWNIRNLVSHGLLTTVSFDYGMADRVIHAFLLLSTFKLTLSTETA